MTITTTLPTNALHTDPRPQPTTRLRSDDVTALPAALRSEWIKLRSLRSTPGLLGAVVVIGVLLSWILATFVKTDPNTHLPFTIGETFVFSTWLTMVLAIVMGTLSFTSEVQHGTLATAVTTQPARWVIVMAKAVVGSGLGLAMGILGMAAGLGGAVLGGLEAGDTSGSLATAGWGLLLTALAPMLGLGIGMIIRHSAGAITTVLVWALVIENLTKGFAPARVRAVPGVPRRGPQSDLFDKRDRVAQRPIPARCQSARPLPQRASSDQMPLPGDQIP